MNEMLNGRRIGREEIIRRGKDRKVISEMIKADRRSKMMKSSVYSETKNSERVSVDSKWGKKALEDIKNYGYFRG